MYLDYFQATRTGEQGMFSYFSKWGGGDGLWG